jgi:hypothetical protein
VIPCRLGFHQQLDSSRETRVTRECSHRGVGRFPFLDITRQPAISDARLSNPDIPFITVYYRGI